MNLTAKPLRYATSKVKITPAEAKSAIYLDYEGNKDKAPTLLGWAVSGTYKAAIVEPLFATCADRYRAKGIYAEDHANLVLRLITQAEDENRLIVSWSEHDLVQMANVLKPVDIERLLAIYRNAIRTARPWHHRTHGKLPGSATLDYFESLTGYAVPEKFGLGLVGEALRLIRSQLKEGRDYSGLSDKARVDWVKIVKHNRHDLIGMAHVLRFITSAAQA
jgi:hypothetical protein